MALDSSIGGRAPGRQGAEAGYHWVSPSPSPEVVERLEELFPEVVALPEEELEAEMGGWQRNAVIVRSFQRWVPSEAFVREFRRAGVQGEIQGVSLAFRCHIFRFASQEARDLVIKRPWVVNGQLIGAEVWRPQFSPAEDSIASVLLWVRLPNLPLEFWREDFLKAILASAGEFVCVDSATLAKHRGAFARACLRVDLRRPLRPGSRVQGVGEPFWQQFSYENLQGICERCGAMHLGAPCSVPVTAEVEDAGSLSAFGPWLSAVRQRRSGPGPQSAVRGRNPVHPPSDASKKKSGATADGWEVPRRVARRRPASSSASESLPVPQSTDPSQAEANGTTGTMWNEKKGSRAGLVTENNSLCPSVTVESREQLLKGIAESRNPFASLHMDSSVSGSFDKRDACPGP